MTRSLNNNDELIANMNVWRGTRLFGIRSRHKIQPQPLIQNINFAFESRWLSHDILNYWHLSASYSINFHIGNAISIQNYNPTEYTIFGTDTIDALWDWLTMGKNKISMEIDYLRSKFRSIWIELLKCVKSIEKISASIINVCVCVCCWWILCECECVWKFFEFARVN